MGLLGLVFSLRGAHNSSFLQLTAIERARRDRVPNRGVRSPLERERPHPRIDVRENVDSKRKGTAAMDTLLENGVLEDLPVRDDGTIDLTELARRALESILNQVMDAQADELCGEGNRRNGYRERRLVTVVGEVTLRVPKLREGSYFPDDIVRPYSRMDRAIVSAGRP